MKITRKRLFVFFAFMTATLLIVSTGVVSWLIRTRMVNFASDWTTRVRSETLSRLESNLALARDVITNVERQTRHTAGYVANDPAIITSLEHNQDAALQAELERVEEDRPVDFILIFDTHQQLVSMSTGSLPEQSVEERYKTHWPFKRSWKHMLNGNDSSIETCHVVADFDFAEDHRVERNRVKNHEALLGILSATIIEDDFGDRFGLCVVGKWLNHNNAPLDGIYEATGFTPIITCGDEIVASGVKLRGTCSTKIPQKTYRRLAQSAGIDHFTLPLESGISYLCVAEPIRTWSGETIGLLIIAQNASFVKMRELVVLGEAETLRDDVLWAFVIIGLAAAMVFVLTFMMIVEIEKRNLSLERTVEADRLAQLELRMRGEAADMANQAKSRFLAHMTHEIRTPMSAILMMIERLLKTDLSDQKRKSVLNIKKCGNTLLAIVNDILDLSMIESGKLSMHSEPFDLLATVQEVIGLLEGRATELNVNLRLEYPETAGRAFVGDALRIKQILINLTGNAIKFSEGGNVTVSVVIEPDGNGFSNALVKLVVADDGVGMSEKAIERAFEEYQQVYDETKRNFGGTGLGLTICKKLTELLGGAISVESVLNKGTVFTVTLNLPTCLDTELEEGFRSESPSTFNARVLLVDDYIVNQTVMGSLLSELGCEVDVAHDGREGLSMAIRKRYDIVFTDMEMPGLNGFEMAAELRRGEAEGVRVPIVLVTSTITDENREKSKSCGIDAVLMRPVFHKDLAECLDEHVPDSKQRPGNSTSTDWNLKKKHHHS